MPDPYDLLFIYQNDQVILHFTYLFLVVGSQWHPFKPLYIHQFTAKAGLSDSIVTRLTSSDSSIAIITDTIDMEGSGS